MYVSHLELSPKRIQAVLNLWGSHALLWNSGSYFSFLRGFLFLQGSEAGRLRVRLGAVNVSWHHFVRLLGSPGCHPFMEILLHGTVSRAFHEIPLRYNGFLLNISHT